MKNILGIVVSPRNPGNCELMVKEISRNIPEAHELHLLRLPAFDIRPCKACYACLFEGQQCLQKDDLAIILDALVKAEAFIMAVPTYFLGAHSSLKRLLDRGLAFYGKAEGLWGKPAVAVGIAGLRHRIGATKLQIESFLKIIFAEIKGIELVYGALPGEIFLTPENKDKAAGLGQALFAPSQPQKGPCCPLCGGDSFRFLDDHQVHCLLCGNPGVLELDKGKVIFRIASQDHELFLSRELALTHADWLRQMKDRFLEKRKGLKEICLDYRKEGTWIKPQEKHHGD